MDIRQHNVQNIKFHGIKPVLNTFYRVITIRTDNNEIIEIILHADQIEKLEVTL